MTYRHINDVERLKKINAALISRVERSMDQQGNAFTLFQTAINLEERIKALSMLASSPLADDPSRWPELYGEARNFLANFQSHVIFADEHRRSMFSTRAPYGATLPRLARLHRHRQSSFPDAVR